MKKINETAAEYNTFIFVLFLLQDKYTISPESCYAKPTKGQDSDSVKMWQVTT